MKNKKLIKRAQGYTILALLLIIFITPMQDPATPLLLAIATSTVFVITAMLFALTLIYAFKLISYNENDEKDY